MIIIVLMDLVLVILRMVLSPLQLVPLPELPDSLMNAFNILVEYTGTGVSILRCFIGNEACVVIGVILTIILSIEAFMQSYSLLWWFIRKLPFFQIKE